MSKTRTGTLADLRPNTTVHCMVCEQKKPQVGSEKFHSHHVCKECAAKVRGVKEKTK